MNILIPILTLVVIHFSNQPIETNPEDNHRSNNDKTGFYSDNAPCHGVLLANDMLVFQSFYAAQRSSLVQESPVCGTYSGQDDWYKIVVPASGAVSIELDTNQWVDASFSVYRGGCDDLKLINCITDAACSTSAMPVYFYENLMAGDTLFLRIWNDASFAGFFNMRISNPYGNPYQSTNDAAPITVFGQGNCIELTEAKNNKKGCSWYPVEVDFSQAFEYRYSLFFGTSDFGADGMAIVFQNNGIPICGTSGQGMGAGGIASSWIVEFDTFRNGFLGDPGQDHVAIDINGNMRHQGNPPVPLPNIEDGQFHDIILRWNPATLTFVVEIDGIVRIIKVYDIVNLVFNGDSMVHWGVTASTGGSDNQHILCFENIQFENKFTQFTNVSTSICDGEAVLFGGENRNVAGIYFDTLQAINGCDSIVGLHLAFRQTYKTTQYLNLCAGETYQGYGTSGIYVDSLQSITGCDSIVFTTLEVYPENVNHISISICPGQYWNGYSSEGIYYDTLSTIHGCDSIVVTDLVLLPEDTSRLNITLCAGESIFGYSLEGSYTDTLQAVSGCDSLRITTLSLYPELVSENRVSLCEGQSWNGYSQAGLYIDTLRSEHGCDSIVRALIDVLPTVADTKFATICGDTVYAGYSSTGIYQDTLTSISGCDSVHTLFLTVYALTSDSITVTFCSNEPFRGQTYTPGTFEVPVSGTDIHGCRTDTMLFLFVLPVTVREDTVTLCDGENWNGYTSSGVVSNTYVSLVTGCDSTVHTYLRFLNEDMSEDTVYICEGQQYMGYSREVSITDSLQNIKGCDSLVVTYLKIKPIAKKDTLIHLCWGEKYHGHDLEGQYTDTLTASNGCDSLVQVSIRFFPERQVLPNIFSPDGNDSNDYFKPLQQGSFVRMYALSVYDRYGNLVFKSSSPEEGWDGTFKGKPVGAGVYVYSLVVEYEGCPVSRQEGTITVLR